MTDAIDQARRDWLTSNVHSAERVSAMNSVQAESEVAVNYPGGNGAFVRDHADQLASTRYTADVVALAGDTDPQVLLIRRAHDHDTEPGKWALPGGHVDPGEDSATAAIRELREETGLDLHAHGAGMYYMDRYDTPGRDPRGHYVTDVYLVRLPGPVPVAGADDADEAVWMPLDEALMRTLAFDHPLILRAALNSVGLPPATHAD